LRALLRGGLWPRGDRRRAPIQQTVILFLGAWSFGMRDLLGLEQMRAWVANEAPPQPRLKTGWLYRWLRHPMRQPAGVCDDEPVQAE
jgi:hypothetical protein